MNPTRTIKLRWVHGVLDEVTYEVARMQLWRATPHTWQPAINAFSCETAVRICVELAGIEKSAIDLNVEPQRIIVRGTRKAPEPTDADGRALRVLALEIDYGPFEREVRLPAEIEVKEVHAKQENGLLWICLPLKK